MLEEIIQHSIPLKFFAFATNKKDIEITSELLQ